MSAGGERIIVNCGASLIKGAEWAQAMRATAAHSTLTVADTLVRAYRHRRLGACELLGTRLVEGPTHVDAKRRESEDGI